MKEGIIYYLKRYHKPFVTSRTENTQAVINLIDDNVVHGHYLDDPEATFICCKHEFSKIFTSKPSFNSSLPTAPSDANLAKIAKMYLSDDTEDKYIACNWLCQLIGIKDANANLFILSFYKDLESDSGETIDDKNWWDLKLKTYPVAFGKDYRYTVTAKAVFAGIEIANQQFDYSRFAIGNDQPKWDFCRTLCDAFKKLGHTFYDGLFKNCR